MMTGAARKNDMAIAGACDFLLGAQKNAVWKDFLLPAGNSDIWVTAFTGLALAGSPEKACRDAARNAWSFLESAAGKEGGWSYNASVPGDADSTLWTLRLADALGAKTTVTNRAQVFLESHLRPDGGVATYASADSIRQYIGLPPVIPFSGWTHSHVCVTAAASNLPDLKERLAPYLLECQKPEGSWPAYWWFDEEYTTSEAAAALAGTNAARRAIDWAISRIRRIDPSNVFAMAHCLRTIAPAGSAEARAAIERGLNLLREWQRADGSWPPSAKLRVPPPAVIDPDPSTTWRLWAGMPPGAASIQRVLQATFNIFSPDHYGIYTTATVLRTLHEIEVYSNV